MSLERHSNFQDRFAAAFYLPAQHRWESKRGQFLWHDLEIWQSLLAGPVYSVNETGGCGYVYEREDEYFGEVRNPATLHTRLLEWHDELTQRLRTLVPRSTAEAMDISSMRRFAAAMLSVIEEACDLERLRWDRSHGPESAT